MEIINNHQSFWCILRIVYDPQKDLTVITEQQQETDIVYLSSAQSAGNNKIINSFFINLVSDLMHLV